MYDETVRILAMKCTPALFVWDAHRSLVAEDGGLNATEALEQCVPFTPLH